MKIAIKRGVQNTNNKLMAEELKVFIHLLLIILCLVFYCHLFFFSNKKMQLLIYLGKDFISSPVSRNFFLSIFGDIHWCLHKTLKQEPNSYKAIEISCTLTNMTCNLHSMDVVVHKHHLFQQKEKEYHVGCIMMVPIFCKGRNYC